MGVSCQNIYYKMMILVQFANYMVETHPCVITRLLVELNEIALLKWESGFHFLN